MWYSVWSSGEMHTSYASAPDETNWTKHGSPVLSGTPGEWDEGRAVDPFVMYDAPTYTMWYDNAVAIGVASTDNPTDWTKHGGNPVFSPGTASGYGQPVIEVVGGNVTVELDGLTITGGGSELAGGVYAGGDHVIIRDCLIRDNLANGAPTAWGGGGVIGDGNLLTIVDSVIVDNRVAQGAGGVRVGLGNLVLSNTLVADNRGDMGVHLNGPATVLNSTIAGNDREGILFNPQVEATLLVTNSIIHGNEGSIAREAGTAWVDYSDVEGGWSGAGTGNIDADPRFVDPADGDYRLGPGSPAIDAGTNAGAPDHDLDGNPRPVDGDRDGTATTDMGAYEFISAKVFLPVTFKNYKP
jgi:hypothetical protein